MNQLHAFDEQLSLYHGYCADLNTDDPFNELSCMYGRSHDDFELYDAIITDPPYNMNERIRDDNDNNDGDDTIYKTFLKMASKRLRIGGRVVFFVPQVGANEFIPLICHDDEVIQQFSLIHSIRQQFSSTFSRYLVVMEKNG